MISLVESETYPLRDPEITFRVVVSGIELDSITRQLSAGGDSEPAKVNLADEFPSSVRGMYKIEGTLKDEGSDICTVDFQFRLGGFGGVIATAATATSVVAGIGALASAPLTSNGMNAKLKLKVNLQRRRSRGWRRFIPVPAWKRTILSALIGAITGLAVAVVLQQAGVTPLSLIAGIWALITGGGVTFGIGYSLGAIRTYLRPPEVPQEETG